MRSSLGLRISISDELKADVLQTYDSRKFRVLEISNRVAPRLRS